MASVTTENGVNFSKFRPENKYPLTFAFKGALSRFADGVRRRFPIK